MKRYRVLDIGSSALIRPLSDEDRGKLKASLTLHNTYTNETLCLYKECGQDMRIPRGIVNAHIDEGTWTAQHVEFKGQLREEQKHTADGYLEHVKHYSGGIIKAPTGTGKTVIALYLISELSMKTLIIVPTTYLLTQWIERVKTFLDLKDSDIGIVQGPTCDYKDKKIVIGMIHSLSQREYEEDFYSNFGLVAWDECHKLGATTFSETAWKFNSLYRLGLSATPKRKDGMANVFVYHIGHICNSHSKIKVIPKVIKVTYMDPSTSHYGCVYGSDLNLGKYLNRLSSNQRRNTVISKLIHKAFKAERDTLLLVDRLDIVRFVNNYLSTNNVPKSAIGKLTGADKTGLDKQIILGTYGSAGLGADIPRLSTLVLGTPRAEIEQAVGRILRGNYDSQPVIIDIVDGSSSIMVGWSSVRDRFYRTLNCEFKHISSEDL